MTTPELRIHDHRTGTSSTFTNAGPDDAPGAAAAEHCIERLLSAQTAGADLDLTLHWDGEGYATIRQPPRGGAPFTVRHGPDGPDEHHGTLYDALRASGIEPTPDDRRDAPTRH